MKTVRRIIACICSLFVLQPVYSQATVQDLTVSQGLEKAKAEDKVLMVVMDDSVQAENNAATSQALSDSDALSINKWAIVIRPAVTGPDWSRLNQEFYIAPALGTLFFNGKEVLVDRYDAISPHGSNYASHASVAFFNRSLPGDSEQLAEIERSGFSNITLLEKLADTRNRYNKPTDDLAEPFVTHTPADSFRTYRYFYLLARLAPTLSSNADSRLRQNEAFDSLWYKIPPPERANINRRIIKKTMDTAVQYKDSLLAKRAAAFAYNTMGSSPQKERVKYQLSLITDFYFRVHDTASYLSSARQYADDYLMSLSIDSLKAFYINKEKDSARLGGNITIYTPGANAGNLPYFSQFRNLQEQLNRFAWRFYKMTDDTSLLLKALSWSKRSLEFNPSSYAMDTYAHLLYATGNRQEGIAEEKKALAELQKSGDAKEAANSQLALDQMLGGMKKID